MKRVVWQALLSLLAVPLVVALLIPFTERGTAWLLQLASSATGVSIKHEQGTLFGDLKMTTVAWGDADLNIELKDVDLKVFPSCLWHSKVCFDYLRAAQLQIDVFSEDRSDASTAAAEEAHRDEALIRFPIPMETTRLRVDTLVVNWSGGSWKQGLIEGDVTVQESTIKVRQAQITEAKLSLEETDSADATSEPFRPFVITLPLDLQVDQARITGGRWDVYGEAGQLESISFAGRWLRESLNLSLLQVGSAGLGQWQGEGGIEFNQSWPVALKMSGELPQLDQWPNPLSRKMDLELNGPFDALRVRADNPGDIATKAELTVNLLEAGLPFQLKATSSWSDALALSKFADLSSSIPAITLIGPLQLEGNGTLESQEFQLQLAGTLPDFPQLNIQVAGSHQDGQLQIDDLRVQDEGAANTVWAKGAMDYGETLTVSAVIDTSMSNLQALGDYAEGSVSGQLTTRSVISRDSWNIELSGIDLSGKINTLPATVSGSLGIDNNLHLIATKLDARINETQVRVNANDVADSPITVSVVANDIGHWVPDTRGGGTLTATISSDFDSVSVTGSAQSLFWEDVHVVDGSLSASYTTTAERPFSLNLSLSRVSAGVVDFQSTHFSATGNAQQQTFTLGLDGDLNGMLELKGAEQADGQWLGELATTQLTTTGGNIELQNPVAVQVEISRPTVTVDSHCWQFQQTRICPGQMLLGENGSASVSMDGRLEELAALLPPGLSLQGQLKAQASAKWEGSKRPSLTGDARASSVIVSRNYGEGETASVSWDLAELDLNSDDQGLTVKTVLSDQGQKLIALDMQLPAQRDDRLNGSVEISSLQLDRFKPFAPMLSSLSGDLNGKVSLSGSLDALRASGEIKLSDGVIAMLGNPTELSDFELSLIADGENASLTGQGQLGGGDVSVKGRLASYPEWSVSVELEGDRNQILLPPYTRMEVSENLVLSLAEDLVGVSGDITVFQGVLEHEQLPEGSVTLSDDVVEVDDSGTVIYQRTPFDTKLDVNLEIKNKFRITGDIVDATLGGNLQLRQSPKQPIQVFGSLNVIGGELRAYQQRLRIQRGSVAFTGPPDNPELNVRAQREISTESVTVGIHLTGTAKAPRLDVFSDPPMSHGEAMSYLIRGRGVDAGAGTDSVAMALTVGSGIVNQSPLMEEINKIPGISGLEFGAEGSTEEDTAATLGGYIGKRLYLSYGVGIYEPINVLTARLYLQTRLWLEVVSQIENSVDLYYSFDIN